MTAFGTLLSVIYFFQRAVLRKKETIVSGLSALIWFMSGLNIFVSGLLGEYITRIYDDVKGRQRFIIDEFDENKAD